ncbi:hypothetical protein BYT27DRAFT_7212729 [Phlegmacium glaucopus]|nr:hypothetical protein BYT27DRAFT_7212729 [Phlegmacium glaucopus]
MSEACVTQAPTCTDFGQYHSPVTRGLDELNVIGTRGAKCENPINPILFGVCRPWLHTPNPSDSYPLTDSQYQKVAILIKEGAKAFAVRSSIARLADWIVPPDAGGGLDQLGKWVVPLSSSILVKQRASDFAKVRRRSRKLLPMKKAADGRAAHAEVTLLRRFPYYGLLVWQRTAFMFLFSLRYTRNGSYVGNRQDAVEALLLATSSAIIG